MSGRPITHHISFISHILSQMSIKSLFVRTRPNLIYFIVATHKCAYACLKSTFISWIIHFKVCTFINIHAYFTSVAFLMVVCPVFYSCHHFLALYSRNDFIAKNLTKNRIFATDIFKVTSINRNSLNIDAWS